MAGGRPRLVHRPQLVTRSDGRYEVRCNDCLTRAAEPVPIGIGLPVRSRIQALEMLRNHVGPAAWKTSSQTLPAPVPGAPPHRADVDAVAKPSRRTA